jgi:DNA-binding PadR family transcriptional regulator
MAIQYAILGLLSWRPLAGYDLKKIMAESPAFYWSGNNNQIYKTLVQMHKDGLVTTEVRQQESYPPRKEYTVTAQGREELRLWVLSAPEPMQLRNTFLIQLAWADQLEDEELDGLLARYEHQVEVQVLVLEERERRGVLNPQRTARERYLWQEIAHYYTQAYAAELAWVRRVRAAVKRNEFTASGATEGGGKAL